MTLADLLKHSQAVLDPDGRIVAVQISIANWRALIDYVEELEDSATVQAALSKLRAGPDQSGALHWRDVRDLWSD